MTSTAIQAVIDIEIYLLIFCVLLFPNPEKLSPAEMGKFTILACRECFTFVTFCNVGNPYICTFLLHLDIKLLIPFICDFYSFLPIFRSLT